MECARQLKGAKNENGKTMKPIKMKYLLELINYCVWEAKHCNEFLNEWLEGEEEICNKIHENMELHGFIWKEWSFINAETLEYVEWVYCPAVMSLYPAKALESFGVDQDRFPIER